MDEMKKINKSSMMDACNKYFDELVKQAGDSFTVVGSCNKDVSRYLVPKGTEHEITYYGKPYFSFRVSDHWNWRASTKKCVDPHHVQCFTKDLHFPFRRPSEHRASKPVYASCVGYYGPDKQYHIVCGEVYDSKIKGVRWITRSISDVITEMQEDMMDFQPRRKSA